ncbi:MAG TPA: hypothetical protein ENK43_14575 [Planctomycetes bacterium]|nr:hypothetical protein [Planctomycetota bacterium]
MFCRELVQVLYQARERLQDVRLLFVASSTAEESHEFFSQVWPEARAVADPEKRLYEAFGLSRASWGQILGPRVVLKGILSLFKGHGIGNPVGDPRVLSGFFLLDRDGRIVWERPSANSADIHVVDEIRTQLDTLSSVSRE